ncbi:hypothetical protein [Comamonas sp. lk]|uniref:hypothetical protein n=1 Tax=Comamonas sp. lk TaxID=2201272 RepID=UPI000EB4C027|nr:hypothetical protein [Comamonas sp. lk]
MQRASVLNPGKEKRLQSLARRAGDLEIKAMDAGQRDRAYHFMRRMYRLLEVQAVLLKEKEASRG